jgi:hypothetical protein
MNHESPDLLSSSEFSPFNSTSNHLASVLGFSDEFDGDEGSRDGLELALKLRVLEFKKKCQQNQGRKISNTPKWPKKPRW